MSARQRGYKKPAQAPNKSLEAPKEAHRPRNMVTTRSSLPHSSIYSPHYHARNNTFASNYYATEVRNRIIASGSSQWGYAISSSTQLPHHQNEKKEMDAQSDSHQASQLPRARGPPAQPLRVPYTAFPHPTLRRPSPRACSRPIR